VLYQWDASAYVRPSADLEKISATLLAIQLGRDERIRRSSA